MDDGSLLLGVGSFVAAVVAVGISIATAVRQSRLAWSGNHIPIIIGLLGEYRSRQIWQDEQLIWKRLQFDTPPASPNFATLPSGLQSQALNVCNYYQMISYLVFYEALDEELAFLYFHFSIRRAWQVLEPYIRGERLLRGDEYGFFNAFEELVKRFEHGDSFRALKSMTDRHDRRRRFRSRWRRQGSRH